MFKLFTSALTPRFLRFRKEALLLWRAFRKPGTPLYLKAAMVFVVAYLINPFDLIPEVLPFIGIIDDLILVPLMMSWIVARLPEPAPVRTARAEPGDTIDGTARRL